MDFLEIIHKELDTHPEWDLWMKARYLYWKSCEYFSYDYRVHYVDSTLKDKIKNRTIDLTNVDHFEVVCSSWSRYVYLPLLQEFGISGELRGNGRGHEFVEFTIDSDPITADACIASDLARVKMKNNTVGYILKTKSIDLSDIDQMISYIQDDYSSVDIEKQQKKFDTDWLSQSSTSDDLLIEKIYAIKEMVEEWPLLSRYADYYYVVEYLMLKFLNSFDEQRVSKQEIYDDNWNFTTIYTLNLIEQQLYFLLTETDHGCQFYEATEYDVSNTIKTYRKKRRI